jgi:high-affinity nickel-transport protein
MVAPDLRHPRRSQAEIPLIDLSEFGQPPLTITAASVIVALFIGGIEALGVIGDKLELEGGFWGLVGSLNDSLTNFGFVVVGIFIASWLISSIVYRVKGYDRLQVD